jgi:hypothetical protein
MLYLIRYLFIHAIATHKAAKKAEIPSLMSQIIQISTNSRLLEVEIAKNFLFSQFSCQTVHQSKWAAHGTLKQTLQK